MPTTTAHGRLAGTHQRAGLSLRRRQIVDGGGADAQRMLEGAQRGLPAQLGKFAFSDAKRLFRQHRSDSEKLVLKKRVRTTSSSGHKCRFCRKSASGMADVKAPAFDPQKFAKWWMMLSSGTKLAFQPSASM
jgi:hypothetical protein